MISREAFRNPPAEFRPMPFWFWNSRINPDRVEEQIRDFHDKGLGGFFIHARFGLETEYLGPEWMECVKRAVAVAAELGMQAWLYDENGFPSGIGGLQVSSVPEYRAKWVDLTEATAEGPGEVELPLPEGEVLMAFATPAVRKADFKKERIDLFPINREARFIGSRQVADGMLRWKAPGGKWLVMIFSRMVLDDPTGNIFGVDYLSDEAMRKFFEITLEPYARELGEHFGKTIPGIFTDEPTLLPWHHDIDWYRRLPDPRVVPWNDGIPAKLKEWHGLEIEDVLPHVFADLNEHSGERRVAFYKTISRMYVESFFRPYREWCDAHNLKLTGHVLLEEGLYCNTMFEGDVPACLSQLHIPGTDHLGAVTELEYGGFNNLPKMLTNIQGEKLVSSIAHLYGKEACLSETYGCAGWCLTFEQSKQIADWQYLLGVNFLCPHAVFYSIEGFRKTDAPPSHNHNPSWDHYRRFADYVGRLSYLFRGGRHVARVALLYPLESFWSAYKAGQQNERDQAISDAFDLCCLLLPRLHYDYDIVPMDFIKPGNVADGKLRIRDEEFQAIIAPPIECMDASQIEALKHFVRQGGMLLRIPFPGEDQEPIAEGEVILPHGLRENREEFKEALAQALRSRLQADPEIHLGDDSTPEEIRCLHIQCEDDDFYLLVNTDNEARRGEISFPSLGQAEIWDIETGNVLPAPVCAAHGCMLLNYDFPPYGSLVLSIRRSGAPSHRPPEPKVETITQIPLDGRWTFHSQGLNAAPLDDWRLRIETTGNGTNYYYSTVFDLDRVPGQMLLMLDDIEYRGALMGGMDIEIAVNNRRWRNPEFGWIHDPGFKTLDITRGLRKGENRIGITIRHNGWTGEPKALTASTRLLGDFAVEESLEGEPLQLGAPGHGGLRPWTELGYPFYSGVGVYRTEFDVPEFPTGDVKAFLILETVHDIFEARLNGKAVGARLWRPWELEITDALRTGSNGIEILVTNSMVNFLEARPKPSGLSGPVRVELRKI